MLTILIHSFAPFWARRCSRPRIACNKDGVELRQKFMEVNSYQKLHPMKVWRICAAYRDVERLVIGQLTGRAWRL